MNAHQDHYHHDRADTTAEIAYLTRALKAPTLRGAVLRVNAVTV